MQRTLAPWRCDQTGALGSRGGERLRLEQHVTLGLELAATLKGGHTLLPVLVVNAQ